MILSMISFARVRSNKDWMIKCEIWKTKGGYLTMEV